MESRSLRRALVELEAEGQKRGIIADGRFPMFEHGTVLLFHNDHTHEARMRGQRTYKAEIEYGHKELKLINQDYWKELDEIADIMSVLVQKPNALIGGCPEKDAVGASPEETEKYYALTDEAKAVVEARGIVADDCCSFLRTAPISDKLHVNEEAAPAWAAYVMAQSVNAQCVGAVQKQLFTRHTELLAKTGAPFNFRDRRALLNDVRLRLLRKELALADILAEQGDKSEFAIVPPVFTQDGDGGGSDQEDMVERRRNTGERREKEESIAGASVSVLEGAARSSASSATPIPVDLDKRNGDSSEEEREEPVPPVITREVLSNAWRNARADSKIRFVVVLDEMNEDGRKILEYCMGLEQEQGEVASAESEGKAVAAVPSGTALQEKRYRPPFSDLGLYNMGSRASGVGITPLRNLIYAEAITQQALGFQKKLEDAAHEDADPDADGAGPTRLTEDRWLKMSASDQAKRLGYPVRKAAFKGTLDAMSWHCKPCREVNSGKSIACMA